MKWSAFDFAAGSFEVGHTVVKNLKIYAADQVKSCTSHRAYQLLPEVRTMLLALRHADCGRGYLFHRSDGSPMRPDCFTRIFRRVIDRAGLPPMRFHDLRHSTASILFDRGWSLEDVKQWLGHADIETTSNIYLHYQMSRKVLMAKDLTGALM